MLFVHVTIVMLNVWFLFTGLFIPFFLLFCFGMSQRIPIRVLVKRLTVTTQIWITTRHQYGISELVPQTSFPGETSCRVAKYRRSYQANFLLENVCPRGINKVRSTTPFRSHANQDDVCSKFHARNTQYCVQCTSHAVNAQCVQH